MDVPQTTDAAQAAGLVDEHCRRLGFALWGVSDASPSQHEAYWQRFADEGRAGTMGWLADTLAMRADVEKFIPGARSVIAMADAYIGQGAEGLSAKSKQTHDASFDHLAPQPLSPSAPSAGKVARYAHGRDYHKVIKKRLHTLCDVLREHFPGEAFRATVDTAPLHEREHAARAGLGWVGKNTLLIHPRHGSYLLLGCVVSTLRIEPFSGNVTNGTTHTRVSAPITDHCANCTRCIDACPTNAIDPAGYAMDPRKCISYLTIEHDGDITCDVNLSGWIAGCDICQEVCPYNTIATKPANRLPVLNDYAPREHAKGLSIAQVMQWDEQDRLQYTAGTALTRINLEQWKRNAKALK